jgi:hypothetical protein
MAQDDDKDSEVDVMNGVEVERGRGMALLRFLITVEDWAKENNPRAQPYFDADAVRWMDANEVRSERHLAFHPQRFDAVMKAQGD